MIIVELTVYRGLLAFCPKWAPAAEGYKYRRKNWEEEGGSLASKRDGLKWEKRNFLKYGGTGSLNSQRQREQKKQWLQQNLWKLGSGLTRGNWLNRQKKAET